MKVLIACEESQVVCKAFRARGHEAFSCDIKECSGGFPEWHIKRDCLDVINDGWDLIIAHPVCTYLTCSAEWAYSDGPYHQKVKASTLVGARRRAAREAAIAFVMKIWNSECGKVAIENPRGVLSRVLGKPSFVMQPYEFGHNASKATCIWTRGGLIPIAPTKRVNGRMVEYPKGSGRIVERWGNQTDSGQNNLPPSKDRASIRSRTYDGIGLAMAEQWG